jgi:azurin
MHRPTILAATALVAVLALPAVAQEETLVGTFDPVNSAETRQNPIGDVRVSREGDAYTISMTVDGLSPGMHLAHIHGFAESDPQEAACAGPLADENGDDYVDLVETRSVSGVTLVPLTDEPASLSLQSESYPTASAEGQVTFETTVAAAALGEALQSDLSTPVALERRVIYLHGVPEDLPLPDSVQTLEGVPAHVTLPVACAELEAP